MNDQNPNSVTQEQIAQVIANSFYAMEAGESPEADQEINSGHMQLAFDLREAFPNLQQERRDPANLGELLGYGEQLLKEEVVRSGDYETRKVEIEVSRLREFVENLRVQLGKDNTIDKESAENA